MSVTNKHDDVLFKILKDCKVLPTFFDVIFGFLKRRSDFYIVASDANSPVGLPPGLAENLVRQKFLKWQSQEESSTSNTVVPEVERAEIKKPCNPEHSDCQQRNDESFTTSECYNGAVHDSYSWSQSINDIDIIVKLPNNTSAKQLCVVIQAQRISVRLKDNNDVLLEGELCKKIKHHDAIWSLDNSKLEIHVDKCNEYWWDCLITTEEKLDVTKMDCSRPFEDLPQEAQVKIEELTWNQERKRLGLPTSDQIDMENKLKKAWNLPGSPFSGPFDPKSVTMN